MTKLRNIYSKDGTVFDQFETVSCSSSPAAANLLYLPGAGYWFGQNRLANDRQYQRSRHASTVSSPSCWIAYVNIPPYSCPTSPWRAVCLNPVLPRISTRCFRQHPSPTERVYSRKNGTIIKCENFSGFFPTYRENLSPHEPVSHGYRASTNEPLVAASTEKLRIKEYLYGEASSRCACYRRLEVGRPPA